MTKIIETNFVNINKNLKDVIEKMIDVDSNILKNYYKKCRLIKEDNSPYKELYGLFSDIIIKIFSTSLQNKIDTSIIFKSSDKNTINKNLFASILMLIRTLNLMLGELIRATEEDDKIFNTIKDIKNDILSISNEIFRMKFGDLKDENGMADNRVHTLISSLLSYYFKNDNFGTSVDENSKMREEIRMKELNEMLLKFLKIYNNLDLNDDGIGFEEIDLVKEERLDSDE